MDNLLTTTQAAKVLHTSNGGVIQIMKTFDVQTKPRYGNKKNYYYACRVEKAYEERKKKQEKTKKKLAGEREERRNKTGGFAKLPNKNTRCECGRLFVSTRGSTQCVVCLTGHDIDDPYNVRVQAKKQTRKCPKCGGDLWTGEYVCRTCRPRIWGEDVLDASMAYGEIIAPPLQR